MNRPDTAINGETKICQFCDCDDTWIENRGSNLNYFFACCGDCDARGPECRDREEAIRLWNKTSDVVLQASEQRMADVQSAAMRDNRSQQ